MVRFLLNVTERMHDALKKVAKEEGRTLNGLIRDILWEWLEEREAERHARPD